MNLKYAIDAKFYELTNFQFVEKFKAIVDALPKKSFTELNVGEMVLYKSEYSYENNVVYQIHNLTKSKKMADVTRVLIDEAAPYRITAASYKGSFIVFDNSLISMIGVKHSDIIHKAVELKLDIPVDVRVEYPGLFVQLPDRFEVKKLIDFVKPQWGKKVTSKAIFNMIKNAHEQIEKLKDEKEKALALGAFTKSDHDKYIDSYKHDIDFYRWLEPHFEKDGIFYSTEQESPCFGDGCDEV
jgi:hypothetical protein